MLLLKSSSRHGSVKEGLLTSYKQVVNQILETYETKDIIAEADTKTVRFPPSINMSSLQYANDLWIKTLRCPQV